MVIESQSTYKLKGKGYTCPITCFHDLSFSAKHVLLRIGYESAFFAWWGQWAHASIRDFCNTYTGLDNFLDFSMMRLLMFEVYTCFFLDLMKCPSMKCFDSRTSQHSLLEKHVALVLVTVLNLYKYMCKYMDVAICHGCYTHVFLIQRQCADASAGMWWHLNASM